MIDMDFGIVDPVIRAVEENGEITGMRVTIDDYDYASNGDGTYEYHLYVFDYIVTDVGTTEVSLPD